MGKISENTMERIYNADLLLIMNHHGHQPVSRQTDMRNTVFSCPFHDEKTPSFKISKGHKRGGPYNSPQWKCFGGCPGGYGAVELEARLSGIEPKGEGFIQVIQSISRICNIPIEEMKDENANGIVEYVTAQKEYTFDLYEEFTIEGLRTLGCQSRRLYNEVDGGRKAIVKDGKPVYRYSFGSGYEKKNAQETNFDPQRITREFHLYQVRSYTTETFHRKSDNAPFSIKRTATQFFPIFVYIYEAKNHKGELCQWGRIYQPEWRKTPQDNADRRFSFFYTGGLNKQLVDVNFYGDAVAMRVFSGESVVQAVKSVGTGEEYKNTRKITVTDTDNGSKKEEDREIPEKDIRATNVIVLSGGSDGMNAYFHLNSIRDTYHYDEHLRDTFFHVVWPNSETGEITTYMYTQLGKLATNKFLMFDLDNTGKRETLKICKRHTELRAAFLPSRLCDCAKEYKGGVYKTSKDVKSFFSNYSMSSEERDGYDGDLNRLFLSCFTAALPLEPLVYKEKKDKKTEAVTEYWYKLDSACLWLFMAAEGYCREVDHESSDNIGRFIHLDKCFVKELDVKSLLAATGSALSSFAQRIARPGTDDYRKMSNAIIDAQQIAEKSAVNLPEMDIDYRSGYGPELDHFFFRNGVLEITPKDIRFKTYEQVNFCVDRLEIMPFDFQMPCTKDDIPFTITENPEYRKKLSDLEEHRKDIKNYTQDMLKHEEQEIVVWSQRNKWLFDFGSKPISEWWQPLQVLRCFANEEYEKEEELRRTGESFTEDQERNLLGHLANIIYSLGRPMFRYKGGGTNYMPYITENGVSKEGRSEGGSGKSVFVNVFMGCACKVLRINSRNLKPTDDISLQLANYTHHCHRVVHWEDWGQSLPLDPVYNYITSGFEFRDYHKKSKRVQLKDSPGHVATSNFQQTYEDPSASGRTVPTGFSHRFNRGDTRRNKPEQKISTVMPGLRDDAEDIDIKLRSQIVYIDAMAIQFCMRSGSRVLPPMEELNNRSRTAAMGVRFMEWAERFFSNDWAFNAPIDFDAIFSDYVELCESSDDKKTKFAPAAFRSKIEEYCADMGYECNPDVCYSSKTDKQKKFMRVKTWCKEIYFDDEKVWGKDKKKEIRVMKQSNRCLFFCKKGSIPVDNVEVKRLCKEFYKQPDPEVYLDPDGNPVALTEEEQEQWSVYMNKKQGVWRPLAANVPNVDTPAAEEKPGEVNPQQPLPF